MVDSVGIAGYFHWDLLEVMLKPDGYLDSSGFVRTEAFVPQLRVYQDYLYVLDIYSGLLIYDITTPENPILVGAEAIREPLSLSIFRNLMFVGTHRGEVRVYGLTSPTLPVLIDSNVSGSVPTLYYSTALWNDLLFAGKNYDSVEVFDFKNVSLRRLGSYPIDGVLSLLARDSLLFTAGSIARINPDASLSLVSHVGGCPYTNFALKDSFYLAPRGYFGLHIFNVADIHKPVYVARWDTFTYADPPGDGNYVHLIDTTAFLSDGDWGITKLDVGNVARLRFSERIVTPGVSQMLTSDSDLIYVADGLGIEILRYHSSTDTNGEEPPLPSSFLLHQNYPNPFNSETVITYELLHATEVNPLSLQRCWPAGRDSRFRTPITGSTLSELGWDKWRRKGGCK